jgi:hypothetical protein
MFLNPVLMHLQVSSERPCSSLSRQSAFRGRPMRRCGDPVAFEYIAALDDARTIERLCIITCVSECPAIRTDTSSWCFCRQTQTPTLQLCCATRMAFRQTSCPLGAPFTACWCLTPTARPTTSSWALTMPRPTRSVHNLAPATLIVISLQLLPINDHSVLLKPHVHWQRPDWPSIRALLSAHRSVLPCAARRLVSHASIHIVNRPHGPLGNIHTYIMGGVEGGETESPRFGCAEGQLPLLWRHCGPRGQPHRQRQLCRGRPAVHHRQERPRQHAARRLQPLLREQHLDH